MEGRFGESLDFCTLRETLKHINEDVTSRLACLDLGQGLDYQGYKVVFVVLSQSPVLAHPSLLLIRALHILHQNEREPDVFINAQICMHGH
jgi:hypothetical protein